MTCPRPASIRTSATAWFGRRATATNGSATSRSRSRFDARLGAALGLALALLGCGEGERRERDIVARIQAPGPALELDRRVVQDIAARDGISEAQAQDMALDQLRWVAARQAEHDERDSATDRLDLDPARREHLQRAAMVRLWLREVFEPAHAASTIPRKLVEQNLADPRLTQRMFHPELWFVCQALILPRERDEAGRNVLPPTEPDAGQAWRAAAHAAFAPLVARVPTSEADCSVLERIVGASEREFDTMVIRSERFIFAPSEADALDREWVEQVTTLAKPGIIGPFATSFGIHLVIVSQIEPATLANDSLAPEPLAAAREAKLRGSIEQSWRAEQLQRKLAGIRDRRIVRLAP